MNEEAKLLPCPFCGGRAVATGTVRYDAKHEAWFSDGTRVLESFFCNCMSCGIDNKGLIGHQTREKAIKRWNHRATQAVAGEVAPTAQWDCSLCGKTLARVPASSPAPARQADLTEDHSYPEGFDASCGLSAHSMRTANGLMTSLSGKREWDVPMVAAALESFRSRAILSEVSPARQEVARPVRLPNVGVALSMCRAANLEVTLPTPMCWDLALYVARLEGAMSSSREGMQPMAWRFPMADHLSLGMAEVARRLAHAEAERDALREALREIALAGMSGTGQESEEGMRDWHARRAWEFIGIAARALSPPPGVTVIASGEKNG